jgi:hypothetical protein
MAQFQLLQRLREGGWATTITQHTKITPSTVSQALSTVEDLVNQFNSWLNIEHPDLGSVALGEPTGSGYWYHHDDPNREYGDIDLQMIANNPWGLSHSAYASRWNQIWDQWVSSANPDSVISAHSTPGHPIIDLGANQLVQVDFMWHEPHLAAWGLGRSVPPRGIKGLLNGNLFSVLGRMLDASIQHSGVQIKTQDGVPVSFAKQKGVVIKTISGDPQHFLLDILSWVAGKPVQDLYVDPLLRENPGVKWPNPQIEALVKGIKGLAISFEKNDLFGHGVLKNYTSAHQWLAKFLELYETKAITEIQSAKRSKAETALAQERAERDRTMIANGLALVKRLFVK